MKKKIAIVFSNLQFGGAEKALIEMLKKFDYSRYDVTLFTYDENGAFLDKVPDCVKICYTKGDAKQKLFNSLRHLKLFSVLKLFFYHLMIRLCKDEYSRYIYSIKSTFSCDEYFDCAIAYKMNYMNTAQVIHIIKSKKKCAFVHSNFTDNIVDPFYKKLDKLDIIYCVSKKTEENLLEHCPWLKGKTAVVYNLYDSEEIEQKSNEPTEVSFSELTLVTVGRLSPEKGQQMIPDIALMLKNSGIEFKWYLIGDGSTRIEIEEEIKKLDIENEVVLLGTKDNPYPFIKNCTIYVQPSFSESWGLAVQEARILKRPIVVTPIPVMNEQIVNNETGMIVEDFTPESLFSGIKTLIDNSELRQMFINNLSKENCDNSDELQKLYDFIES